MDAYAFVDSIVSRITDLDVVRVVLFGSAVGGVVTDDSDLDLAVVFEDPPESASFNRLARKREIRRRIRDINFQVAIDLVVYSESEFTRLAGQPTFLRSEIVDRGRTVYERAG